MTERHEDRLRREIAALPPVKAPPGFTERVLERAEERATRRSPERGRRTAWRPAGLPGLPAWAAAGALGALVLAATVLMRVDRAPRTAEPERRLEVARGASHEALEREYRSIAEELEDLRRLADETAPVLYLTSTDEFDVVLDLRPLLEAPNGQAATATQRRGEPRQARRNG